MKPESSSTIVCPVCGMISVRGDDRLIGICPVCSRCSMLPDEISVELDD